MQREEFTEEIAPLFESLTTLTQQAYAVYSPIAASLCSRRGSETKLSHCLDGLLSFANDPRILGLFKQLCREYFGYYPECIADYVMAYKDLWGGEDDLVQQEDEARSTRGDEEQQ